MDHSLVLVSHRHRKTPPRLNWASFQQAFQVDRHLALFVRLLSLILKDNSGTTERPELATRLATLEKKLLKHDDDLASGYHYHCRRGRSVTPTIQAPV